MGVACILTTDTFSNRLDVLSSMVSSKIFFGLEFSVQKRFEAASALKTFKRPINVESSKATFVEATFNLSAVRFRG